MKTNHRQILQNVLFRLTCFAQLNVFPYYHRLLHLWRLLFNQNNVLLNGCRAKTYAGLRPFFPVVDQSTSRAKKDSDISFPPPGEQDQCKNPSPPGPTLAGLKLIGLVNINVHFLQIEMESQKNTTTNLERISADLKQMKDENNTLAKKLKAAK